MAETLLSGSSSSPPPTPNQAHHVESITSFLINSESTQIDPSPQPSKIHKLLVKISHKINKRFKRCAKYPSPFDRYFEQLDLWKLLAVLGAMVTAMATFHNFNLISKVSMHGLVYKLGFAMFFLTVAYTLQDLIPEIAVTTMLSGFGLVIACFHIVVINLLDLPEKSRHLEFSGLFVGYVILLLIILYNLLKEDVRVKEEIEEDGLHVDMV